ncbi:MAG TPA: hypothetical protein VII71_02625 [Verrucomicrobiae bacterium]
MNLFLTIRPGWFKKSAGFSVVFRKIPSLKSDTASDTILSFWIKLEPKTTKGHTLKTADGTENQSIESMRNYENQSNKNS